MNIEKLKIEGKVAKVAALSKCLSKMVIPTLIETNAHCSVSNPYAITRSELEEMACTISELISENLDEIYDMVS